MTLLHLLEGPEGRVLLFDLSKDGDNSSPRRFLGDSRSVIVTLGFALGRLKINIFM